MNSKVTAAITAAIRNRTGDGSVGKVSCAHGSIQSVTHAATPQLLAHPKGHCQACSSREVELLPCRSQQLLCFSLDGSFNVPAAAD